MKNKLPRLPIPSLQETCESYLHVIKPLITSEEFKKNKVIVDSFKNNIGKELQQYLKKLDKRLATSYVYDFWIDKYLQNRSPLLKQNVAGLTYYYNKNYSYMEFAKFIALILLSVRAFIIKIQRGTLENDAFCGKLLSMKDYNNIFSHTRVPGEIIDELKGYPKSKNIIIEHNGHCYSLNIFKHSNINKSFNYFYNNIKTILQSSCEANNISPSVLTCLKRKIWHQKRLDLLENNKKNLQLVESSLFFLSIDDSKKYEDSGKDLKRFLFGKPYNHWFDKSLQVIINKDKVVGFNMEHTGYDGSLLCRASSEILLNFKKYSNYSLDITKNKGKPKKINWNLSKKDIQNIENAKKSFRYLNSNIFFKVFNFEEFGAKHEANILIQFALQLAYYKTYNKISCFYESVLTRNFNYGRTEAMRPVSIESKRLVEAVVNKRSDIKAFFKAALKKYKELENNCKMGKGVDRHLFALEKISQKQNIKTKMFHNKTYKNVFAQDAVSSSCMLKIESFDLGVFTPTTSNGFGVFYIISMDGIDFCMTHKNKRRLEEFSNNLEESLSYFNQISLEV